MPLETDRSPVADAIAAASAERAQEPLASAATEPVDASSAASVEPDPVVYTSETTSDLTRES